MGGSGLWVAVSFITSYKYTVVIEVFLYTQRNGKSYLPIHKILGFMNSL